jgi:predicted DNA binding CopG/RHH family protein
MKYYDLDDEEKLILREFNKGAFKSVYKAGDKKLYSAYAKATNAKTKNINIRLANKTLLKIKAKALHEGIPYQTLISSVLHKFAMS